MEKPQNLGYTVLLTLAELMSHNEDHCRDLQHPK